MRKFKDRFGRKNLGGQVQDLVYVLLGSIILAIAITGILEPNGIITGGITGFSLVLEKIIHIHYTYIYWAISLMVLVATYVFLGGREASKIAGFSLVFPVVLILFSRLKLNFIQNDLFLACVYYGVLAGGGTGLILKGGFSSGGTDTIAKIINRKLFRFMSISTIIAALDISVIFFSAFILDTRIALYGILTQVVAMKAVEIVLYGFSSKVVKLEIISEYESEIESYILNTMRRGISKYHIVGGYTNLSRIKLVTLCSPRESILVRDMVAEIDPKAFISVLPVNSVWGEGVGFDRLNQNDN